MLLILTGRFTKDDDIAGASKANDQGQEDLATQA